jgi:hypothetical protein
LGFGLGFGCGFGLPVAAVDPFTRDRGTAGGRERRGRGDSGMEANHSGKRKKGPGEPGPFSMCLGDDLLSHPVTRAVPSAQEGLTSGFGMEPGVSPPL